MSGALFGGCLRADVERRADGSVLLHSAEPLQPYPLRLTDKLVEHAARTPEKTFAARRAGGHGAWQAISYAQMLQRARSVASWLLQQGASAERPLAILSDNDLEHLTLALGAMWAGVPWVPISPAYSLLSQDFGQLRHIVKVTTPGVVFAASPAFARAIEAVAPADARVVMTEPAAIAGRPVLPFAALLDTAATREADAAMAATGPDTIVKFLFTSGSTKDPKGVINTHRMLCANQQMLRQTMACVAEEPPVLVDWLPWNHTFGGNHNVGIVLYNGGTLYIDDGKPTPKPGVGGIAQTIANLREIAPTVYFNVPRGFEELADAMQADTVLRERLFSRVRCFMYAGAGLAQAVWDRLDALAVATRGEPVPMITGLGMTETAPACVFAVTPPVRSGDIGLPCPGVTVKLVPNAEGSGKTEVRFKGPNVMPGYWRAPEQTAAAFDDEGFYRTGDAVLWADAADPQRGLRFDGRIAEDFKLASGTFVSVGPLRAAVIAAGDPLVQDVVVAGLDRNDIGLLVFPRLDDVKRHCALPATMPAAPAPGPPAPAAPRGRRAWCCWPSRRRSTAARSPTRAASTSAPCSRTAPCWWRTCGAKRPLPRSCPPCCCHAAPERNPVPRQETHP
jgi:feruloyl-CoA synthase